MSSDPRWKRLAMRGGQSCWIRLDMVTGITPIETKLATIHYATGPIVAVIGDPDAIFTDLFGGDQLRASEQRFWPLWMSGGRVCWIDPKEVRAITPGTEEGQCVVHHVVPTVVIGDADAVAKCLFGEKE